MDDARLQSLYRRHAARRAAEVSADDIAHALAHAGAPDEEGQPLDRIAASPLHADVLRAALALAPDAATLSGELAALRAPRRAANGARRWLALAAALGAVALTVTGLRGLPEAGAPAGNEHEMILSASFESSSQDVARAADTPIFVADFDS
jgi:hypothetical protein